MSDSEFEIVSSIPNPVLRRLVRVNGVEFDEAFVAELISNYFNRKELHFCMNVLEELLGASRGFSKQFFDRKCASSIGQTLNT